MWCGGGRSDEQGKSNQGIEGARVSSKRASPVSGKLPKVEQIVIVLMDSDTMRSGARWLRKWVERMRLEVNFKEALGRFERPCGLCDSDDRRCRDASSAPPRPCKLAPGFPERHLKPQDTQRSGQ